MRYDKIIILNDLNFVRSNFNEIEKITNNSVVVPLSDAVFLFLKKNGINCLDYHGFEYKHMYDDVYPTARNWGLRWYTPKNTDISSVNSFSLGKIIEWQMIYFFSHILRLYLTATEIIKNIKPKEILLIVAEDNENLHNPLISEDITTLLYADLSLLQFVLHECIESIDPPIKLKVKKLPYLHNKSNRAKLTDFIKQLFIYVNLILSKLYKVSKKHKRLVFFEGFHHFYNIMKSPQLRRFEKIHLQKVIGPTILFKLYLNGVRVESFMRNHSFKTASHISFNLEIAKRDLSDFFIFRGNNLFSCMWPRIELLFKRFFPELIYPDLATTINVINHISPNCIVTENDSTYYEKMLVVVAKKFGIQTVVIQHGVTWFGDAYKNNKLSIHDFYPLTSDMFFTFGKTTKDWFVNMGTPAERLIITGSAKFDTYYKNGLASRKHSAHKHLDYKTILILLNDIWFVEGVVTSHIGLNIFYNHICEFAKLAKQNPQIRFIVRPRYDAYHIWSEIFKEELKSLNNFIISDQGAIEKLFPYVDLVIGYISTALLEALIYKIPVISLDTDGYCESFPLWKYGLSRRATSFNELDFEIKRLLYEETDKKMFLENIKRNLHLFNYNNDGFASRRIAEELTKIM